MTDKKKTLRLRGFRGPVGTAHTSQGEVYVYPMVIAHIVDYSKRQSAAPEERGRAMLQQLASLQRRGDEASEEIEPLPDETLMRLSDQDVVAIADAYRGGMSNSRVVPDDAATAPPPAGQQAEETPYGYFDRLIGDQVRDAERRTKQIVESFSAKTSGLVGSLAKDMLAASERLTKTVNIASGLGSGRSSGASAGWLGREPVPPAEVRAEVSPPLWLEGIQREQRAREEDRERAEAVAEATLQLVELQNKLVTLAGAMIAKWDDRSEEEEKHVNKQLRIAVVALVISTVLAAISAWFGWYGKATYEHDLAKEAAEEQTSRAAAAREERLAKVLELNAALLQQNAALLGQQRASQHAAHQAPVVPAR